MLSPVLTREDVLAEIKMQVGSEQFERLSSITFKGKRCFKKNDAYSYEAEVFHDMCNYSVTPDRLSELMWANHEYNNNNGEEIVLPQLDPYTIKNIVKNFFIALKEAIEQRKINVADYWDFKKK